MGEGLENLPCEERLKELGLHPGEEKAQGHHHSILVLKGWLQKGWKPSLHKEPQGEDKGQQVQTAPREVLS